MTADEIIKILSDDKVIEAAKSLFQAPTTLIFIPIIISVFALIAVVVQTYYSGRQVRHLQTQTTAAQEQLNQVIRIVSVDHDRAAREFAVRLTQDWSNKITQEMRDVKAFILHLSYPQCSKIASSSDFQVPGEAREALVRALVYKYPDLGKENPSEVNSEKSAYMRWVIVSYLNLLESTLSAWHYKVAHAQMIEDEFAPLVKDEGLTNMIKALGDDRFPAICAFMLRIREKCAPAAPPAPTAALMPERQ